MVSTWRDRTAIWRLWPLLWAPVLVNIIALAAGQRPMIFDLLTQNPNGEYGLGGWLTFFVRSMEAWGPAISILAVIGLTRMWQRNGGLLIIACTAVYFAAHTAIRALGLADSGGYARFLVPISPLVAVGATFGWQALWQPNPRGRVIAALIAAGTALLLCSALDRQLDLATAGADIAAELPSTYLPRLVLRYATSAIVVSALLAGLLGRWPALSRGTAAVVPAVLLALIGLTTYHLCRPLPRPAVAPAAEHLRTWLAAQGLDARPIVAAHPWLVHWSAEALARKRPSIRQRAEQAPPGTLFIWDSWFAGDADPELQADLLQSPAYVLLHRMHFGSTGRQTSLAVFEKINQEAPLSGLHRAKNQSSSIAPKQSLGYRPQSGIQG
jgi:hypothetical protein